MYILASCSRKERLTHLPTSNLVHDLVGFAGVGEVGARAGVLAPGVGVVEGGRLVRLRRVTTTADGTIPHAVVDLQQHASEGSDIPCLVCRVETLTQATSEPLDAQATSCTRTTGQIRIRTDKEIEIDRSRTNHTFTFELAGAHRCGPEWFRGGLRSASQ